MTRPTAIPYHSAAAPEAPLGAARPAAAVQKAVLRHTLLQYRQQMAGIDRENAASIMAKALRHLARRESWRHIAVYLPWRDEPDLRGLWQQWQRQGLRLALPAVVRADAPLEMLAWAEGAPMARDAMGLPVPADGEKLVCDTWVIPCVGVGPGGERLGAGKGFYDRSIAEALRADPRPPLPRLIGLCFGHGLIDQPFAEPHDARLDACLTELGYRDFRPTEM